MNTPQARPSGPGAKTGTRALLCALLLTAIGAASTSEPKPGEAAGSPFPWELRSLIDQEGRPLSFATLANKTVLVNFIFTSCPMKCPAQTQALVGIQRALPKDMLPRIRFVSMTVDPERDSAAALKRYAIALGAELSGWSFVTGNESDLNRLYRFFSVGVNAIAGGQYDHQMGAYLLDGRGRVMQRYIGDIDKPRLLREIGEIDALNKK